jgi:hypothetical protein
MSVLLNTGILGIGNQGNMVAALANSRQVPIPVLGLNTSERDIDAVKSTTSIDCLYIGDGKGAGKDRTLSKEALKSYIESFMGDETFQKFIEPLDVVFIVSSTGGGTGSGASPMMADILRNFFKDKIFILVGTLPTIGESVGAQRNTIEYLVETERLEIPYMLFDNGNSTKNSTNDVYDQINGDIVDAVCVIRGDYNLLSKYGMIDTQDMKKLITLPGLIHINLLKGIYQEKIPSDGSIEDLIVASLKKNTMITPDRDKIVKRRGYIANLSEDIQPYFNKDFPKITEIYGEAAEVFDHYSVNDDDEKANYVVLINSGLSLPENRLKSIQHRIEEVEEALKKKKESSILATLSEKVGIYDGTTARANEGKEVKKFDLGDILSKY